MTTNPRKRGLGMGLSALLGDAEQMPVEAPRGLRQVPIEHLQPSPLQPRRHFGEEEITALAASMRDKGVLQPLVVRPQASGEGYEIVAGERRWRAAQQAGLAVLPVIVRELADRDVLEVALIENVQREDLNPLEEARAYRRLVEDFDYTQDELATAVGKSRSHVANLMRLLNLPEEVQRHVIRGELSAGHARALLGTEHAVAIAREVMAKGFSVRQTEELVAAVTARARRPRRTPRHDPDLAALENRLAHQLGLAVAIRPGARGGSLTIRFSTADQLDQLVEKLFSGG